MRHPLLYEVKLVQSETFHLEEAGGLVSASSSGELVCGSRPRWYLVQCRSRQEDRALEHLERQGFECYRPLYEKEHITRGRKELVSTGLFPGYLFILLDRIHDNWLPIRSTRGVIQIVRFNEYPLPVADGIVEELRRRIEHKPTRVPYLKSGEHVVISEGTFAGIEAVFLARHGHERVMLLLNILQSDQTLSFPIESVYKLK
jgi:transcriptional antiterminator RfaH